jgi:phospholipid transport system substrate-binding protein
MKTAAALMISALLVAAFGVPAHAQRATEEIKTTTNNILTVLNNPSLQGDEKKAERRKLLGSELDKRFNWTDSARSCLGRHWAKRTPAEQKEFITLFSKFLEQTYLEKFEVYYGELDKLDYVREKVMESFASVKVNVTTKEKLVHPVEYRMNQTGGEWKVYDVIIEGTSLVKNYRDQFDEVIGRSSYEGLIKDLKAKSGK